MTRNIQHSLRVEAADGGQHLAGARPWRVQQHVRVVICQPRQAGLGGTSQVGYMESGVGDVIQAGVVAGAVPPPPPPLPPPPPPPPPSPPPPAVSPSPKHSEKRSPPQAASPT